MRVATSVNHWLRVFPPSAFLVVFQTDSCVLQTNSCKWPVESCDYSPLLWCAPTRETIRTDHSGLAWRSGLYRHPHGFAEASPILFLKKKFTSFRASSLPHLSCAAKPVISCMTQYVSVLSYSARSLWVWDLSGFLSQATCLITFCKVRLMIVIFIARGLKRLTHHGMFGNWEPSHFLAHSLFICSPPTFFLGYKLLVVFIGKK